MNLIINSIFDIIKFLIIIVPVLISVAYLTLAERKVIGYMQARKGPNVVGLFGLLQPLADGVKLFAKEMIIPNHVSIFLYFFAPILALTLGLVVWGVMPFGSNIVLSDLSLGMLLIFALSSVGVYAILMSGWSSNSKYAFLGALRAAAQMISYEVSIGLIIITTILCTGSLNLSTIIFTQNKCIWFIFPLLPAAIMFFISCLAETNRAPFDLTEGESELVSGFNVEYSSMSFALFFLAEYSHIIFMSFLFCLIFLGGNSLILFSLDFAFFIKSMVIVLLFIWVRASYPRLRYDQLMHLLWKTYLPLSLALVLLVNCLIWNYKRSPTSNMFIKILFFIPFIAIINIIFTSRFNTKKLEKISLFWSTLLLLYFFVLILIYTENSNFQFGVLLEWFPNNNLTLNWGSVFFALDGISLFIGLSIILIPISILMSWKAITHLKKEFILSLFVIVFLLIGVFSILDILGFYILFEAILIPMFLVIGVWGSREEKVKAAFYFFFYTLIGSLLMLISIFKIYSALGTTNYQSLIILELPTQIQFWLFLGFFASLAVKIPMIPFHIWLPQAHVEAPVAGSVLLAGILLKLGGYGFIRFSYPLFPIASEYFTPIILLLSLLALIYGSLTTCRQTDIKRLIAYSSVAHMGLVTLSIFVHSMEGLIASITMMIAHGLVSSGLFMTSAVIYVRHHSRAIRYFRGLTLTMPIFSTITLILVLANIGFPLTFNFIAELFSILAGLNYSFIIGALSCIGALLSTVYALYYYNRIYFGVLSSHLKFSREMMAFEFQSFMPLILLTIILGIFPNLIFRMLLLSSYTNISL